MDLGKVGRMVNGGDRQQPPPPFASLHYEQFARANRDNKSFVASLLTPSTIVFMFELFLARTVDIYRRTQFKLLYESPNVMECVPAVASIYGMTLWGRVVTRHSSFRSASLPPHSPTRPIETASKTLIDA